MERKVLGREPQERATWEPLAWASYRAVEDSCLSSQIGTSLQDLRLMSRHVLALWRNFDVMLSPVTLTPPPKIR